MNQKHSQLIYYLYKIQRDNLMDFTFREWFYQFKNVDARVDTLAKYAYCGADFPDTREFDKVYSYLKFTAGADPELIAGFNLLTTSIDIPQIFTLKNKKPRKGSALFKVYTIWGSVQF